MRPMLTLAVVAGLTAGGANAQAPAAAPPSMDEAGVQWKRWPRPQDMQRFFPLRAHVMDVRRGSVDLACTPDARGKLDCTVLNEAPAGYFFGDAAKRVLARAEVAALDGRSPAGRTFSYRMRFGYWPPRLLPDSWHPMHAGLKWTVFPELSKYYTGGAQAKDTTLAADFSCTARRGGEVDCTPKATMRSDPRFVRAALRSLKDARVARADGAPAEGVNFDWTMKLARTANCGTGKSTETSAGGTMEAPNDAADIYDSPGGSQFSTQAGGCIPSIVQTR